MRVLHVIPSIDKSDGGPSKAIRSMEHALIRRGVSVVTATTAVGIPENKELNHEACTCEAKRFYARRRIEFYKVAPGFIPWLWIHVRSFDVVHIHSLFSFVSVVTGWICRLRHVPYIVRPLGTLSKYGVSQRRPWLKNISLCLVEGPILAHAAAVHFTSQAEMDDARLINVKFRGVIIPLGVEVEQAADPLEVRRWGDARVGCKRIILFLSRLDPKKNVEALIDAFASSGYLKDNAVIAIAGSGKPAYVARLRERAISADVDDRIFWLGHVEGGYKASVLGAAHVFVLPSFSENFGIAAVEALLVGLPCILSRGVAIAGDIEAAGAGVAVEPEPQSLAMAMSEMLSDDDYRTAVAARARAFAQSKYSMDAMADNLIALYQAIANSASRTN